MQLLLVKWLDSSHRGGWFHESEAYAYTLNPCESAGYMVAETDTLLALAQSISGDSNGIFGNIIYIPLIAVLSREVLRET